MVAAILIAAVYITVTASSRLTVVVATSVLGYCVCLLFVFYSAPDLAMTQFSIDTLTVVLFVLVLFRLPPFLNFANRGTRIRDGLVASSFGLVIALIAVQVLNQPVNHEVSKFYGDNAYLLAKGKNVVNVIIELNSHTLNKYEIITESGQLKLDRVGYSSLSYPFAYGAIPCTWDLD